MKRLGPVVVHVLAIPAVAVLHGNVVPEAAVKWVVLAVCVLLVPALATLRRVGIGSALEVGLVGFVVASTALLWVLPPSDGQVLRQFSLPGLQAVLCLVAVAPVLIGREPFTAYYARRKVPEMVDDPEFPKINVHLSVVWALLFAGCALFAAVPASIPALAAGPLEFLFTAVPPLVLLAGVGGLFTRWYPGHVLSRRAATGPPTVSAPE